MTVEEQRVDLKAKIAAKQRECLDRFRGEHLARLAAMRPIPGFSCPNCGAAVVSQCATMREPPGWRTCVKMCGWNENLP